jgi:hypothetical protein
MFKQFINGELSLFKTYWLVSIPSFIALGIIAKIVELEPATTPTIIWVVSYLIVVVFTTIGMWNSATKYNGSKIWKWIVKIQCILTIIPFFLAIFFYIFQNTNEKNEFLLVNDLNCKDAQNNLKNKNSSCLNDNVNSVINSEVNTKKNDLIYQLKHCELIYDSDSKKFIYRIEPWIKDDKNYHTNYFYFAGKEAEVESWYPLLRKADKEGRTEEAQNIANIIRENSISVYSKKDFSHDFISKIFFETKAEILCGEKRIQLLSNYAKSDLINELNQDERNEIFEKYISSDSAYLTANIATQNEIKKRYKINEKN